MDFNIWIDLNDDDKKIIKKQWHPYIWGYWWELLDESKRRFIEEYGHKNGVEKISCGIYHGGILIISIIKDNDCSADFPRAFLGFDVKVFNKKKELQ